MQTLMEIKSTVTFPKILLRGKGINGDTLSHGVTKKWYANNLNCAGCHGEYVSADKKKKADQKINVHAIFIWWIYMISLDLTKLSVNWVTHEKHSFLFCYQGSCGTKH